MKRIKFLKEEILSKRSQIEAISEACDKEKRARNEEETTKWNELRSAIDNMKSELKDLQALEADKAERAEEVEREERKITAAAGGSADAGEAKEVEKVMKRYSVGKALGAQFRGQALTGVEAEVQAEAEAELRQFGKSAVGTAIPSKMLETRTDIDQATSGIQPTEVGAYVRALRENAIYEKVGVQVMNGLTADHKIPVVGKQNVAWAAAENSPAADGGTNFSSVTLSPNRLTSFVNVSNTLLIQNGNVALNAVMEDLGRASANVIDESWISASGVTNAPTSIPNTAGILTFTEAAFSDKESVFQDLVTAEETLAAGEGIQGMLYYLVSPFLLSQIKRSAQVTSVTPATPNLGYETQVANGYPVCYSVGNDGSAGVSGDGLFGDFSKVKLGFFGGMDMVLDRSGDALLNDQTRIVLHRHADYKLVQGGAMVKFTSALA